MPQFGLAHNLLSARHPDTSPPAGGADPSDGQVATWSAALKAWIAADPTGGGVTVHGLLTGLDVDDHEQYALADKSRPDPWITAADFAARSLADLGTKDHDLLDGLTDDDHSIYALLSGRSGGQSLIGGLAASEHLTLQSTAHATRGYVKAQDDLQLLTDQLRSAAGDLRVELESGVADVRLHDDLRVDGTVGIGINPSSYAGLDVYPTISNALGGAVAQFRPSLFQQTGGANKHWRGLFGEATLQLLGGASGSVNILEYLMTVLGAGDVLAAKGIRIKADLFGYSGAAFPYTGVDLAAPMLYGATAPSAWTGFHMPDHGAGLGAVATPVTGLHIEDQTLVTGAVHLLELGPATPYLRLLGGGNPDAHESNLLLGLGATLKLVTEYDADSAGVGFRALRVPN